MVAPTTGSAMKPMTVSGPRRLEFGFQFVGEAIEVLLVGLIVAFETIGEAGGDQAEGGREERLIEGAAHHVAAGTERAERVAVVALAAGDEVRALGLADLDEVLAGEFQRGLGAFGAGGAEVGVGQAAGFAIEHDVREVFCWLAAEGAGVGVGHGGGLASDGLGDAAVAVAEAGDRGAAGAIDDAGAVGEVEVDAVAAGCDGWGATGAVEDTGLGHAGLMPSSNARIRASNGGRSFFMVVQVQVSSTEK